MWFHMDLVDVRLIQNKGQPDNVEITEACPHIEIADGVSQLEFVSLLDNRPRPWVIKSMIFSPVVYLTRLRVSGQIRCWSIKPWDVIFERMKKEDKVNQTWRKNYTKDGESIFICKGVMGDWKNFFTPEQSREMDICCTEKLRGTGFEFEYEWTTT